MAGKGKESNDGCFGVVGIFILLAILFAIPKTVWLIIGVAALAGLVAWIAVRMHRASVADREARALAAEKERRERMRDDRRRLLEDVGRKNVGRIDAAAAAIQKVNQSEAAREGWLGDTDFSADLSAVTDAFRQARVLRRTADELKALDYQNEDDRRLLADAESGADRLESGANERVELIRGCATEAARIDESLRQERADAQTAEQRAQLHARLNGLLYGIDAAPATARTESAADRVMARVRGYQEIRQQIQAARDREPG